MNSLFDIASKVSTPLALSGVVIAVLFYIYKQIIKKDIFPKLSEYLAGTIIQSIINKLFILSLVAVGLGFIGYVVTILVPETKLPSDSFKISLPSGLSFQVAAKMIAAKDSQTAIFSNCKEALLNTKVEKGEFGGKTAKDLIEALQYRFISSDPIAKYRVEHLKDRGIYEIHCE